MNQMDLMIDRIIEKHNKDPFARSLVMAVIDEIERSRKQ